MIPAPYLVYLGDVSDELSVKTSRGVAVWTPERCVGEYRRSEKALSLGLRQLDFVRVALNTSKLGAEAAMRTCADISDRLNLPCQDPVAMGVELIVDRLEECFANSAQLASAGR